MAAITKLSQKSGIKYRVTINMAGVRPFSRNFKTMKNARAWAKKTEGDLETARIEGNNLVRTRHRIGKQPSNKPSHRDCSDVVEG